MSQKPKCRVVRCRARSRLTRFQSIIEGRELALEAGEPKPLPAVRILSTTLARLSADAGGNAEQISAGASTICVVDGQKRATAALV